MNFYLKRIPEMSSDTCITYIHFIANTIVTISYIARIVLSLSELRTFACKYYACTS